MSSSIEIAVLARLLETGLVRATARNQVFITRFETAKWISQSGRSNEWKVRDTATEAVLNRLQKLLPSWQEDFAFLKSIMRSPYDPKDIEAIPALRRPVVSHSRINRRTWNAAKGLGPKHSPRVAAEVSLTKDWVVRFRPNRGITGIAGGQEIDFYKEATVFTESFLPERAWLNIDQFSGVFPRLIITCENIAAYVDLPINDSMMAIFSPGADTEPAIKLLNALPMSPWIHFGDYDHEGIEIAKHISSKTGRVLQLFVPQFAAEYLNGASAEKTPWKEVFDHNLFFELKRLRKRIFQEVFLLDGRLAGELERLCLEHSSSRGI